MDVDSTAARVTLSRQQILVAERQIDVSRTDLDSTVIRGNSTDPGNPNKKVKIKWHVNDSKYKFETDGIKFTSGNNNLLTGCAPDSSSDSDFGCDNDTSVQGSAKYTITVKPKNSGDPTPPPLDPTIVNG